MATTRNRKRVPALLEPRDIASVGFEQGTAEAFGRLQAAIRSLIEATPGVTRRPTELAETLGIHAKLAWQAHRIAHAADPLAEAANVPGPAAMKRFLDAAARRGAPTERVREVQAAERDLHRLIDTHAGSRSEFDTMISALVEDGADQIDLTQKRAAFKAQSHILGVQARTHLACMVVAPSKGDADALDIAALRGLIGLRRFRRDASWIISQTRMTRLVGGARAPVASEPIDPRSASAGASVLTDFCSDPLPEIRRVGSDQEHMTNIEIAASGVGNASEVTCLLGDLYREAAARYRGPNHRHHISNVRVRTPCKTLVHDLLVHEDCMDEGAEPRLSVFSDHRNVDVRLENQLDTRACDLLPLKESLVYLGRGASVMRTPEAPRYEEMIRYALGRAGWDTERFHVHRTLIEYPVMPSSVVIHFELPEHPSA